MTTLLLFDTPAQVRRRFVNNVADAVVRSNVRAFWAASETEGLTRPDEIVAGRVWTHGATPTGRLSKKGNGYALAFNGTSDYITAPDAADLSFIEPLTMSAFAVVNVTDTAAARTILSKHNTAQTEYFWFVSAADQLEMLWTDDSAAAIDTKITDAAIAQGAWSSVGFSYSGVGGAAAANGMTVYQNAVAPAQTPSSNAAYVAMEDKAAALEIGSITAHTASFFAGLIGMVLLVGANLSAAQHGQLTQLARSYYGVS